MIFDVPYSIAISAIDSARQLLSAQSAELTPRTGNVVGLDVPC